MVGDVTGYGSWGNPNEVVNMEFLDDEGKKDHIKKLWEENPVKYYEWKTWCIKLDQLPDFFKTLGSISKSHIFHSFSFENHLMIFLRNNNGSYELTDKSSATHILEQIFDDGGNIVQENLKPKI